MGDNIPNIGETIDLYYEMVIKYKPRKRPKMMKGCEVLIGPIKIKFDGVDGFEETLICPSNFSREAKIYSKNAGGISGILLINGEHVNYTNMEPVFHINRTFKTEGKYGMIEFTDQVKYTFNQNGVENLFSTDKKTGTGRTNRIEDERVRTNYEKEFIKCYYKMQEKEGGGKSTRSRRRRKSKRSKRSKRSRRSKRSKRR